MGAFRQLYKPAPAGETPESIRPESEPDRRKPLPLIPAQAGLHEGWVPAFAGTSGSTIVSIAPDRILEKIALDLLDAEIRGPLRCGLGRRSFRPRRWSLAVGGGANAAVGELDALMLAGAECSRRRAAVVVRVAHHAKRAPARPCRTRVEHWAT